MNVGLFGGMFFVVGLYGGDALFPGRIEWRPVWPM